MTVDIELDDTGDIKIALADASLVDTGALVRQRIQVALRAFRNEWFLNIEFGVPYFTSILGQKATEQGAIDSIIKAEIRKINEVNRILAYQSTFDPATREYTVDFTADTIYGPIEYSGVLP